MKVFVYGTLRRHEKYHNRLEGAELLHEQASVNGELFDTKRGYPALRRGESKVYGEVYSINEKHLQKLDELEDYIEGRANNLFDRKVCEVETDKGNVEAYVYYGVDSTMFVKEILSNDWKVHQFVTKKPETVLYYAYGSCMDQNRFQLAGVDQHFQNSLGSGILQGYTMKYQFIVHDGGRGDIIEDGGKMEGVVYDLPYVAVEYLFEREGVTPGWYRPAFVDVTINGATYHDVLTFIVIQKQQEMCPPAHYAKEILRGSKPFVSVEYHQKLQQQLIGLGMTEEQLSDILD